MGGIAGGVAALVAAGVFSARTGQPAAGRGSVASSGQTGITNTRNPGASTFPSSGSAQAAPPTGTAAALDIRAVLRAVEPGVVSVTDFAAAEGGNTRATGEGTGMVLDRQGIVLTNNHVVAGASAVSVQPFGQTTVYKGKVLGVDATDDVAIVQIQNPGPLTPVPLGQSSTVQVGDPVVAIGNALSLAPGGPTVSSGIISALNRSLATRSERLTGLLQTDAPLNPGNSGGPLVDAAGKVIGMNTAVSTDGQNVGFAIPIDKIVPLIETLKKGSTPSRTTGFLGVALQNSTSGGAQISILNPGSPAAAAGLQVGDIITAIDGQPITTGTDAADAITSHVSGAKVRIDYQRAGTSHTTSATLGTKPAATPSPAPASTG